MAYREGLRGTLSDHEMTLTVLTMCTGSLLPLRRWTSRGLYSCKGEGLKDRRDEVRGRGSEVRFT